MQKRTALFTLIIVNTIILTLTTIGLAQDDKSKRPSPPAQAQCQFSDGKTIKTTTKSRFTLRINLKKLKAGRHRLRTVVTDQAGSNKTSTRTIARCAAAKPKHKAAPRFTG